ncbi:MAG: hypothetical protein ACXWRE_10815 [Pseudobdellovibrionaceae bacterium]
MRVMIMVFGLILVLYAMRELHQPSGLQRANANNPLFLLFGNDNK